MEDVSVKINGKTYLLEIAETEEDRYDGLADNDYMEDSEGMIFIFGEDNTHPIVMRGMEFSIDIIHIDGEGMINSIATGNPGDTSEFEGEATSRYVVELLAGEVQANNIAVGMTVELPAAFDSYIAEQYAVGMARHGAAAAINPNQSKGKMYDVKTTDISEKSNKLQVLDTDGKVISNIDLGARIFSRDDTRALVGVAAKGTGQEILKTLGLMVVKMIHDQNTSPPEYSN